MDGQKPRLLKTVPNPVCKVEHFKMVDKRLIIVGFFIQLISNLSACLQLLKSSKTICSTNAQYDKAAGLYEFEHKT